MSLEPPQINVPLTERGDKMNIETYLLLQAIYEKLVELEQRIAALEP